MTVTILQGDNRKTLQTLAEKSVQACVTSPPYYGLRDYGTASWMYGDPMCDHLLNKLSSTKSTLHVRPEQKKMETGIPYKDTCGKCGAVRVDDQIGLESTPEEYVKTMVGVFREVWRVLKDDGTLWLNLGDSYASSWASGRRSVIGQGSRTNRIDRLAGTDLKEKDLIGIPWMVAFALRADGWYLRQDIIWDKPNPMPESVKDRCTKAHEYLFLLSKGPRYYFDAAAVAEKSTDKSPGNTRHRGATAYDEGDDKHRTKAG